MDEEIVLSKLAYEIKVVNLLINHISFEAIADWMKKRIGSVNWEDEILVEPLNHMTPLEAIENGMANEVLNLAELYKQFLIDFYSYLK